MDPKEFKKEMEKNKVHYDSFVYSIKEEYQEEFMEMMRKRKMEMDRHELGGNKKIHVLKENDGQIRI